MSNRGVTGSAAGQESGQSAGPGSVPRPEPDADVPGAMGGASGSDHRGWLLLAYRVPSQPSRARVGVWRDLKRLGAFYLQQAVCVLPDVPEMREALSGVRARIEQMDGTSFFAVLRDLEPAERQKIVDGFVAGSQKEYAEIVEECETKFFKEIEFERFRENYTFEEAEEIRQDLEKLRRWLAKVVARDWMSAPGRAEAEVKVAQCEEMLEDFEADVFKRSGQEDEPDEH